MSRLIPKGAFNLWESNTVDERLNVNLDKEFKAQDVASADVAGIRDGGNDSVFSVKCKACGKRIYFEESDRPKMCPHCGHPFPQE